MLSREQQRVKEASKKMLSVQLWSHLTNLIREIKTGDLSKLPEFQQFVQYAPSGMKIQLLKALDNEDAVHS